MESTAESSRTPLNPPLEPHAVPMPLVYNATCVSGKLTDLDAVLNRGAGDTVYTGTFAVAWNVFVGFWTVGAVAGGGVLVALFSLPFWAAGFMMGR